MHIETFRCYSETLSETMTDGLLSCNLDRFHDLERPAAIRRRISSDP